MHLMAYCSAFMPEIPDYWINLGNRRGLVWFWAAALFRYKKGPRSVFCRHLSDGIQLSNLKDNDFQEYLLR
jgi:hypothetical protein